MTSRRNTLITPFRVPQFLGSGHFSLVSGQNYSKKSKLAYSQKLQETSHFWTFAATLLRPRLFKSKMSVARTAKNMTKHVLATCDDCVKPAIDVEENEIILGAESLVENLMLNEIPISA